MKKGFTLTEVLVVMGIFAILSGLVTVTMARPQRKAAVDTTADILAADLHTQHIKSMNNFRSTSHDTGYHGIYFEQNSYTLFHGNTYSALDDTNFEIVLSAGAQFSDIDLAGSQIVFTPVSGNTDSYDENANSVTIQHGDIQSIVSVNEYGTISIQ